MKKNMIGFAIRTQPRNAGSEHVSAERIIDLHEKVFAEKGCVYFSTNLPVAKENAPNIGMLILFNTKCGFIYRAEVDTVRIGKRDSFIPEDSAEFSPKEFADVPAATWLRLRSLEQVEEADIASYRLESDKNTTLIEKIRNDNRSPKFYFDFREISNE